MRERLVKHQIIEYRPNEPFFAVNANSRSAEEFYVKNSHWHAELELAYAFGGRTRHFIDDEAGPPAFGRRTRSLDDAINDPDYRRDAPSSCSRAARMSLTSSSASAAVMERSSARRVMLNATLLLPGATPWPR